MNPRILIIGATGKLGRKLLNFCNKNKITINCITCYKNTKLLDRLCTKYKVSNKFCLSKEDELIKFYYAIKKSNFDIIYFLDFGSSSLALLNEILNNTKKSLIAIANKEMIVAGGKFLLKRIKESSNFFIPLDSEHFSLINSNISNGTINKVYITASGGPLYFKKKINLRNVSKKLVLSHPKWKMGVNNLIDSSNFINKVLEMFELSSIFDIDINKIGFLLAKEAYIHSIVEYDNEIVSYNSFNNDMLITLAAPLRKFFNFNLKINKSIIKNTKFFNIEKPNDSRFHLFKHLNKLKKLNHHQQIEFMILNNIAQKLYIEDKINYNDILPFILSKIDYKTSNKQFRSFNEIIFYIYSFKQRYIQFYDT